jgi:hypothetical protein
MKRRNFSTVRKMTKGVRMVHQDLLKQHPLDPVAERILDCMRGRISPALQGHFMQLLRSFDEEMQVEMADDLLDFSSDHIAHTTGVISADVILDLGYKMIAYEHNILKKKDRSRMRNLDRRTKEQI